MKFSIFAPAARGLLLRALLAAGALACAAPAPAFAQTAPRDTLALLSAGYRTACLTTTRHEAYCWGDTGEHRGAVVRVGGPDGRPARLRSISASHPHLCGITAEGDVWCDRGLTGGYVDSAGARIAVPDACGYDPCVFPLPVRGALPTSGARGVAAGWSHACAWTATGAAYCWGGNDKGQLGGETRAPDSTGSGGAVQRAPSRVAGGVRFVHLAVGAWTTCGVSAPDGAVHCWGYGQSGQTGDSAVMQPCGGALPYSTRPCSSAAPARVLPEAVPGERTRPEEVRFRRVAAGYSLSCAVSEAGGAYCWGSNYRCALGRCGTPDSPRAVRIQLPGRAVDIGAGERHACALTADGRIFCWGENNAGQLGSLATANAGPDGGPPDYRDTASTRVRGAAYDDPCFQGGRCSPAPVEVSPGRRWAALAVGGDRSCALAAGDGRIHCWGGTDAAALGSGARLERCDTRTATWGDLRCQPAPVAVPGLPRLAPPPAPGGDGGPGDELAETRVVVTRREVRVVFPPEPAGPWGWSDAEAAGGAGRYAWSMHVDAIGAPRTLFLRVNGREGAREFATLDALVAEGRATVCPAGMMDVVCVSEGASARVEDGRVVLLLRDSAAIARMFGLRPAAVTVGRERPGERMRWPPDSVRVEYAEPRIPLPGPALRAEAAREERRFRASITSAYRYLATGDRTTREIWIAVSDTVGVWVAEGHCSYDVCYDGYEAVPDSGWTVADPAVARLLPAPDSMRRRAFRPVSRLLAGLRPGRTRVRVVGLHSALDTLPSREPVPREVEAEVVVTLPVARVELSAGATTARVGETVTFRMAALDERGSPIEGAPVRLEIKGPGSHEAFPPRQVVAWSPRAPGSYTATATFAGRTATAVVEVSGDPP